MNMYLYTCKEPKNKVLKASNDLNKWYLHFALSGKLKDNTSLTDPVFEIAISKGMLVYDGDGEHTHYNTNFNELLERINKINYMALPEFIVYDSGGDTSCRYYFVNSIEICESVGDGASPTPSVTDVVIRLYCHIDVLMTYRYNIKKSNSALIVAQQHATGDDLYYRAPSIFVPRGHTETFEINISGGTGSFSHSGGRHVLLTTSKLMPTP